MKKVGYINCPEHGKQQVEVEVNTHLELCERYTAKCPKCNRRLPVNF